jgi:hypothetical protein
VPYHHKLTLLEPVEIAVLFKYITGALPASLSNLKKLQMLLVCSGLYLARCLTESSWLSCNR